MTHQVTEFPKGTYLNRRLEPAQAGEKAAYRVENLDTAEGKLIGVAVPLTHGPTMVRNRTGLLVPQEA